MVLSLDTNLRLRMTWWASSIFPGHLPCLSSASCTWQVERWCSGRWGCRLHRLLPENHLDPVARGLVLKGQPMRPNPGREPNLGFVLRRCRMCDTRDGSCCSWSARVSHGCRDVHRSNSAFELAKARMLHQLQFSQRRSASYLGMLDYVLILLAL